MTNSTMLREAVRDARYRGCISTAAFYLRDLASVVGKKEAAELFGHRTYRKALRSASQTFILHNPQLSFDLDEKAAKGDSAAGDGILAEVVSRVTTSDKDWDGDIVHPEGLIFDTKGPYLWMHAQSMPIGTLRQVISQDESEARCKFALADIQLARDALALLRIKALRNSIGFRVLEAEPLGFVDGTNGTNGKQVPTGFDIKRAAVLETSAVAIPANPNATVLQVYAKEYDAVRSLASQKSLQNPIVRKWADAIYDARTKVFAGVTLENQQAAIQQQLESQKRINDLLETLVSKTMTTNTPTDTAATSAELETKGGIDLEQKMLAFGMDDYADGSFEQAQAGVYRSAQKYLMDKGQSSSDAYPMVLATYAGKALVCMRKWTGEGYEKKTFSLDYKMDGGKCEITGHKAVEIKPQILEVAEQKSLTAAELTTKSLKPVEAAAEVPGGMGENGDVLLEEAGVGKKSIEPREMLVKMITGEIETDSETRKLIGQVARYFETAEHVDGLLSLVR